jgi:hypothetical protein
MIWPLRHSEKAPVHIHYEGGLADTEVEIIASGATSWYVLSLSAAEDFNYRYPESSIKVFEYINHNEV